MATLKTIRTRIASVKNTQKITKAMKMVSAAKLRRAQTRLINARPYADKMQEILSRVVRLMEDKSHPLFEKREKVKVAQYFILTSDRGLCGGFNGNLLRRIEKVLQEKSMGGIGGRENSTPDFKPASGFASAGGLEVKVDLVGRRGRDYFRSRHRELDQFLTGFPEDMPFEQTLKMANDFISGYREGKFDELYLVYNYFRSAISQEIRIEKILPFEVSSSKESESFEYLPQHLYEPSQAEVLEKLIPRALAIMIRRAFLESTAGEYGARMVAMDNATRNSSDMIFNLTLQMNRLRQAAITKELMDIVNGAESLK